MATSPNSPPASGGYEKRDANIRGLVYFAVVLLFTMVLTFLVTRWMFSYFARTQPLGPPPTPFENTRVLPPAPRLQVEPVQELGNYRAGESDVLSSYGWVDRANGVVRIPIDLAMERVLDKGLPVRTAGVSSALNQPSATPPGSKTVKEKK
ncbi:MAG: hypothetical protein ACRD50_01510 [Candidatus Acidiferrales bacterium]